MCSAFAACADNDEERKRKRLHCRAYWIHRHYRRPHHKPVQKGEHRIASVFATPPAPLIPFKAKVPIEPPPAKIRMVPERSAIWLSPPSTPFAPLPPVPT